MMLVSGCTCALECARPEIDPAFCPPGKAIVHSNGHSPRYVALAQAFRHARDGDRIDVCPGRAMTEVGFKLRGVTDVSIRGNDSSLVASADVPVLQIFDSRKVTLENLHVVHEVGEWCAQGCVEVYSSREVIIRGNRLEGSGYFGVVTSNLSDAVIEQNLFYDCHYGVAVAGSRNITLRGNTFRANRGKDIHEGGNSGQFRNDVMLENTFETATAEHPVRALKP